MAPRRTRQKTRGVGQPSSTAESGGVVDGVPTAKVSSISSAFVARERPPMRI